MIYPKQNRLKHWVLDTYVHFIVKRHFQELNIQPADFDRNRSVLLLANHFSVWDGMILYHLNAKITGKKFHVMLLEDTARREPMLKYGGAFSVDKGSRDVLVTLDYAAQLLADPQNMVLIFPQGKLYSNFIDQLTFEKGVLRVMEKAAGKFSLLFATTFVENFKHKKPAANVYLHNSKQTTFNNINELEQAYQQHYNAARGRQTQITV